MAQISSFKPCIPYQVCNSTSDNDILRPSSIKSPEQTRLPLANDDLFEIKISPATNQLKSTTSSNHYTSSLTPLISAKSTDNYRSLSAESTSFTKSIKSSSFTSKNPHDGSSSTHSLSRRIYTQPRSSINFSNSSNYRQSTSRQSIFDTLANKLTAVRKSSITALALAQQRLSIDNGTLFSTYQGKKLDKTNEKIMNKNPRQ